MEANLPLPSTGTLISVLEARMITAGSSYTEKQILVVLHSQTLFDYIW